MIWITETGEVESKAHLHLFKCILLYCYEICEFKSAVVGTHNTGSVKLQLLLLTSYCICVSRPEVTLLHVHTERNPINPKIKAFYGNLCFPLTCRKNDLLTRFILWHQASCLNYFCFRFYINILSVVLNISLSVPFFPEHEMSAISKVGQIVFPQVSPNIWTLKTNT